jgi:hypothetical protein
LGSVVTIGTVVGKTCSTIDHPFYDARKLLVVHKRPPGKESAGDYMKAVS